MVSSSEKVIRMYFSVRAMLTMLSLLQLEVQTAFREQGARLQATYDKKQKAEYDVAKR